MPPAQLRGTWGTVLLPLGEDDRIDFERLDEEIETLLGSGLDGLYSNGTAGEFFTQDEHEFEEISGRLARAAERRGCPFQIGVCHPSAQVSRERLRRVRSLKPSAVQLILPDWVTPSIAEVRAFLEEMSREAGSVPIVLYNPPHAKRVLTPTEWEGVAREFPSVIGMKVGGGNDAWYAAMQPVMQVMAVFVPGHTFASGRAKGAAGSYSNVACLSPRGAMAWQSQMDLDPVAALEAEGRLKSFLSGHLLPLANQKGLSNPALDKLLAAIGGWSRVGTNLRWPYQGASADDVSRLREVARMTLPEFVQDR